MLENMGDFKRTHYCGEIDLNCLDQEVTIMGWVQHRRDHGGLVFIDLRDRTGQVQAVFNPEEDPETHAKSHDVRAEYVLAMKGRVRRRPPEMVNPKLATGEIEVLINQLKVLNQSRTPPFVVEDHADVTEAVRLKYRYLDLRRPLVQKNFRLRHQVAQATRDYFNRHGFIEVETPVLTRSTPEGARDYLVPSRVQPGQFFALPQSPQLFKQMLMIAGFDRYCQIVKCFRDEDLRADRQPEFTQVDLEMSFAGQEEIMDLLEGYMADVFDRALGLKITRPFPRLRYEEALNRYGNDRPDLRYGLEISDATGILANSQARVFAETVKSGGVIKALNVPDGAAFSRKQLDDLVALALSLGAKGLAWVKIVGESWQGPLAKFITPAEKEALLAALSAREGDVIFFGADQPEQALAVLGHIRARTAAELNLIPEDEYHFSWVTHFPMFEYDRETKKWAAMHHPFTAPVDEDLPLLAEDPGRVRAQAYDLVLNGNEIGGGSIRIHRSDVQSRVFKVLGIGEEEARDKFGFLLEALSYGAPPHGGCAFGLDRLVMLMAKAPSLREVIAFPKTQKAQCLTTGAPGAADFRQLMELGLKIDRPPQN